MQAVKNSSSCCTQQFQESQRGINSRFWMSCDDMAKCISSRQISVWVQIWIRQSQLGGLSGWFWRLIFPVQVLRWCRPPSFYRLQISSKLLGSHASQRKNKQRVSQLELDRWYCEAQILSFFSFLKQTSWWRLAGHEWLMFSCKPEKSGLN